MYTTFLSGLVLTLAIGCSNALLTPMNPDNRSNAISQGKFCLNDPEDVHPVTKVLFIIDKSYSNTEVLLPNGEGTLPGTDPEAAKRAAAIEKVVAKNRGKDYFQYGLVAFIFDY